MKFPKNVKRYCPKCKKHTEQKVSSAKRKTPSSAHPMSKGSKKRMKLRGEGRGYGNVGKLSKGALSSWKRYGKKTSKKTDLRYTCKECNKTTTQRKGFRTKRVEFK
ncbi:50S ribosomal protein L44e [Candidatus Woesearchaeota archaeon]|nr:50S ribosomal protein L44e [Candidatus Woesearchaeota archaeon]